MHLKQFFEYMLTHNSKYSQKIKSIKLNQYFANRSIFCLKIGLHYKVIQIVF